MIFLFNSQEINNSILSFEESKLTVNSQTIMGSKFVYPNNLLKIGDCLLQVSFVLNLIN
jgi:hypothetical protein